MDQIHGSKVQPQVFQAGTPAKKLETPQSELPRDEVSIGQDKPQAEWLFMNYIAADCNLTKFQLANIDSQELVGSDSKTHLVAMVDVGPEQAPMPFGVKGDGTEVKGKMDDMEAMAPKPPATPGPGAWKGARTLYITKDDKVGELNSQVLSEHGDHVDMSNPKTLTNFVVDMVQKFPAKNVALIFNDHGGGFTGAMSDDHDGGFMSIPNMNKALKEAEDITGKKLDIIGFDACLMAETEVAYELKDRAKIMLAAEESEGGPGWTYNEMVGGKTLATSLERVQNKLTKGIEVGPYEFAKIVVDVNKEHNNDIPTFSATDLTTMDQLKDASEGLAQAIIKTEDKTAVKNAINQTENYGGGWSPYGDLRDLHHLSRNIIKGTGDEELKKAAEAAIKAVETSVFANEVNPAEHPESKGLTIYAPTSGTTGPDYAELQFAKDTSWNQALESLGVPKDPTKKGPDVWPDGSPRKQNEA